MMYRILIEPHNEYEDNVVCLYFSRIVASKYNLFLMVNISMHKTHA